jgi:hypothetical protein
MGGLKPLRSFLVYICSKYIRLLGYGKTLRRAYPGG